MSSQKSFEDVTGKDIKAVTQNGLFGIASILTALAAPLIGIPMIIGGIASSQLDDDAKPFKGLKP